jgi:hypothetical protein
MCLPGERVSTSKSFLQVGAWRVYICIALHALSVGSTMASHPPPTPLVSVSNQAIRHCPLPLYTHCVTLYPPYLLLLRMYVTNVSSMRWG